MTTNLITLSLFEFDQATINTSKENLDKHISTGTDAVEIYKLSLGQVDLSVEEMFTQLESNDPRAAAVTEAGTKWVAQTFLSERPITLATLRMRAGLSQRELGSRLNVSQPMIAKWEKGDIPNMQLKTLMNLSSALSIDLKELIDVLLCENGGE